VLLTLAIIAEPRQAHQRISPAPVGVGEAITVAISTQGSAHVRAHRAWCGGRDSGCRAGGCPLSRPPTCITYHPMRLTWLSTWLSSSRRRPHEHAITSHPSTDAGEKW